MGISVGGLISGLGTEDIISKLMELERRPILKLQQREADYQLQLTTYGQLRSAVLDFQSSVAALTEAPGYTDFDAVSSDPAILTATETGDASAGSYSIQVHQLAQNQKLKSSAFAEGEAVGEGIIQLRVGNGEAVDIAVLATDTLSDVAEAINEADVGVRANVIYDGTDYVLSLSVQESGESNRVALTVTESGTTAEDPANFDSTGLSRLVYQAAGTQNLIQTQEALDALISVDGVDNIRRPSNIFEDVISGISITLKAESAAGVSVTVSRSTVPGRTKIENFVKAYNNFVDFVAEYQGYSEETGTAGRLLGDSTTNLIRNRLRQSLSVSFSADEGYQHLSELGISFQKNGKLVIDSVKLGDALSNRINDVINFFTRGDDGGNGFAQTLSEQLDSMLSTNGGILAARTSGIEKSISKLQDDVDTLQSRLARIEERYRKQFNALESLIAEYTTTGDYLTQQIDALQNLNRAISNRS